MLDADGAEGTVLVDLDARCPDVVFAVVREADVDLLGNRDFAQAAQQSDAAAVQADAVGGGTEVRGAAEAERAVEHLDRGVASGGRGKGIGAAELQIAGAGLREVQDRLRALQRDRAADVEAALDIDIAFAAARGGGAAEGQVRSADGVTGTSAEQ